MGQGRFGVARGVVTDVQTWLACSERGAVSTMCAVCVADRKGRGSPIIRERVKIKWISHGRDGVGGTFLVRGLPRRHPDPGGPQ